MSTSEKQVVSAELIAQAFTTAENFFPQLACALDEVVAHLQQDRLQEGLNLFGKVNDGLKWFCNMVELRRVWLPPGYDDTVLAGKWSSFMQKLAELGDALSFRDYVLVSDLLEFEVKTFIDLVLGVIRSVKVESDYHVV